MARILIIEDSTDLAHIYRSELEYNGFEIDVISNGEDALSSIETFKPNLILLDIMLPDISGVEVLKKIKANPDFSLIKVIMISNIDAPAVINEAYASGADGYLIKSIILPSQLTDEINTFLK